MTLRILGKSMSRIILAIVEFGLKSCAFLSAFITLGSSGSIIEKSLSGLNSFPAVLSNCSALYSQLTDMDLLGTLYPETIGELVGGPSPAMPSSLVSTINEIIFFVGNANHNLSTDLTSTLVAVLLAFLPIYVGGALVGFVRRGGEDLLWIRMEKKLWKWLFEDEPKVNKIDKTDSDTTTEVSVPEKKLVEIDAQREIQQKPAILEKKKNGEKAHTRGFNPSRDAVKPSGNNDLGEMDLDIQVERNVKEFDEYSDNEVPEPENKELETERPEPRKHEEFGNEEPEAMKSGEDITEENDSKDDLLEEENDSESSVEDELEKELSEAKESAPEEGEEVESEIQKDYSLNEYLQLARS